jgi:peptide/nickel transport system ATP-binding protein
MDASMGESVLRAEALVKDFPVHRRLRDLGRGAPAPVRAVDGVSFELGRGEILGLVGESGCGKTTTGRMIMKLLPPTGGRIFVEGKEVTRLARDKEMAYRRGVQMVFQDPYASLDPRYRVRDVLEEPLLIHKIGASRADRMEMVGAALEKVKMTPVGDFVDRNPHMLSGGQRQRVAVARALILSPRIVVADEPVSMIDLSTRAEILHMMRGIQREMDLSLLYITHDISTARYFTDRIAVMYLGRIVEIGPADDVIDRPRHPYTKALIDAVCEPVPGRVDRLRELSIRGEVPSAAEVPRGCRFHPRCPFATAACRQSPEPELEPVGPVQFAACRRWKEI